MHVVAASVLERPGVFYVIGGGFTFYIAARLWFFALTGGGLRLSSFRLAVAHFLPIAAVALAATIAGDGHVAVCVIFATSVAAMTLNLGVSIMGAAADEALPPTARAWPFLIPVTLLALMAGFTARLTALHGLFFLIEGALLAMVWLPLRAPGQAVAPEAQDRPSPALVIGGLLLAAALAALGGWIAIKLTGHVSTETRIMSRGLVASVVLAPLLILPLIGASSNLAQQNATTIAVEGSILLTLLNLCLLLPLSIGIWYLRPMVLAPAQAAASAEHPAEAATRPATTPALQPSATPSQPTTTASQPTKTASQPTTRRWHADQALEEPPPLPVSRAMPFPMASWRLDTVLLIAVALILLPVALGRWSLGRREGIALIIGYTIYLLLTTTLGMRW